MTQNNITDIEKCARLMGYDDCDVQLIAGHCFICAEGDTVKDFNPRTNKSDLMDLECALELSIDYYEFDVQAWKSEFIFDQQQYVDHPTKFAARAEAVIAVAVQIYDAKYGKDGE